MRIYKSNSAIIIEHDEEYFLSSQSSWDIFINRDDLYKDLLEEIKKGRPVSKEWFIVQKIVAPIGTQDVWAAGVTYLRSKVARMEESEQSGGATFYDKVYDADRPELFYKSGGERVIGPGGSVRIRKDSTWDVPEPELTLVITSSGKIVGYTIGNDMSSRSIEGENPLYLPQAKMYDGSAALGPCILVTGSAVPSSTFIKMLIERDGKEIFEGSTTISQMKRKHADLVEYLFRESTFINGCYLMTGTCVVPGNDFTLQSSDRVSIEIENIGTLVNTVE